MDADLLTVDDIMKRIELAAERVRQYPVEWVTDEEKEQIFRDITMSLNS